MTDIVVQPALTCPACEGISFLSETRGRVFKSTVYQCRTCGTTLEAEKNDMYKVVAVGDEYCNATTILMGKRFKREQLTDTGLPVFSDNRLAEIANGVDSLLDEIIADAATKYDRPPVILKANEYVILVIPNVQYCEERSKMAVSGQRVGFRVMKGVYVSQSLYTPQSQQVIQTLDSGSLIFTNLRYIFKGSTKNVDQQLSKLTDVTAYLDALSISRSNKQKTEFYKGNLHWPLFAAIVQGIAARGNK